MDTEKYYTVLLVDDEEEVVRIIMQMMDWESMGFRPVGYAHNGIEALEMCEEAVPDVVMTDITMPFMDGLALGHRLKALDPQVKLIIFSGFDEFEYAKEAIRLEVEEYLLKPIDMQELKAVFGRLKAVLDKEKDERENLDKLTEYYMESLPMLQESFYTALLEGRISDEQLPQYLNSYQISLTGPYYLAAVVHVGMHEGDDEIQLALRTAQVRHLLQDPKMLRYRFKRLSYLRDIVLIVEFRVEEEIRAFTDEMNDFCRLASKTCGSAVTIGIGNLCISVRDLSQSFKSAQRAVSYRAIYGSNRAINISEIDPGETGDDFSRKSLVEEVIRQIRLGDRGKLEQTISYCVSVITTGADTRERTFIFLLELFAGLTGLGNAGGLSIEDMFADPGRMMALMFDSQSAQQIRDSLMSITLKMQEMLSRRRESAVISFVQKAEEYVREHYADQNVAIETICRYLGVSAAYFSTVFKKETGKTFIGYLTDYRMKKALDLLLTTGDKTYMIAEKVGYADSNYFSYVFKKQFGMSPSKYRQQMKVTD